MHALFVDDEVEFLQLMEKRLSRRGMTIVTAPDGQSALDIVTEAMKQPETMFQVVVMDVRMPGMDGLETLRHMKKLAAGPAADGPCLPRRGRAGYGSGRLRLHAEARGHQRADHKDGGGGSRRCVICPYSHDCDTCWAGRKS